MAGVISPSEIKPLLTTLIEDRYDELMLIKPTKFLQSLFKKVITKVLYPAIDVRRGSERVAVDLILGHQGIRVQQTKATQKIFDLAYFFLWSDISKLQCYWNLFGSTEFSVNALTETANEVAIANKTNIDMIERAVEVWCAEILEYGTVTSFRDSSTINFGRRALSLVDLGVGNYWNTPGVDPAVSLQTGANFIRTYGKYTGGIFNIIIGDNANMALQNNDVILNRAKAIETLKLETIIEPEMRLEGQTYKGTMSAGSYIFHLWMYPQYYDRADSYPESPASTYTSTPYINPAKINMVPYGVQPGDLLYGACPQVVDSNNTASLVAGEYNFKEDIDTWDATHKMGVESRVLPVPVRIDQFWTAQVTPS